MSGSEPTASGATPPEKRADSPAPARDASKADTASTSRSNRRRPSRSDPDPDHLPYPLVLAAGWAWRIIVVLAAVALLILGLQSLSMVVVPLAIALLLTALLSPVVSFLHGRWRFPNAAATAATLVLFLAVVGGLLTFAGSQIASGMSGMLASAKGGLDQIVNWLKVGPLHLSQQQIDDYYLKAKDAFSGSGSGSWVSRGTEWAGTAGHFFAGIIIALFATFFFLAQGERIAVFVISLLPHHARQPTYQAGRRGWVSLTSYIRVQVLVAAVDAVGIGIGALVLQLPFVIAIALLVFLASFIPIVGAIASGAIAVLVALVTHGPVSALVMIGVVLAVQQLESHVLQPVLMGRAVSLHPLVVILGVVIGSSLLGIVGALFAVPLLAVINSVVRYYHGYDPFPALGDGPLPKAGRPERPVGPQERSGAAGGDGTTVPDSP
ncbi:MAG: AI-2E family transporter [Nakamurella sp.]